MIHNIEHFIHNNYFLCENIGVLPNINHPEINEYIFFRYHFILLKYPKVLELKFRNTSDIYCYIEQLIKKEKKWYLFRIKVHAWLLSKMRKWDKIDQTVDPFLLYYCNKNIVKKYMLEDLPIKNKLFEKFYHDYCFEKYTLPKISEIEGGYKYGKLTDLNFTDLEYITQFFFNKIHDSRILLGLRNLNCIHIENKNNKEKSEFININYIKYLPRLCYLSLINLNIEHFEKFSTSRTLEYFEINNICINLINFGSIKTKVLHINNPINFNKYVFSDLQETEEIYLCNIYLTQNFTIQKMLKLKKIFLDKFDYNKNKIIIKDSPDVIGIYERNEIGEKWQLRHTKGCKIESIIWG